MLTFLSMYKHFVYNNKKMFWKSLRKTKLAWHYFTIIIFCCVSLSVLVNIFVNVKIRKVKMSASTISITFISAYSITFSICHTHFSTLSVTVYRNVWQNTENCHVCLLLLPMVKFIAGIDFTLKFNCSDIKWKSAVDLNNDSGAPI